MLYIVHGTIYRSIVGTNNNQDYNTTGSEFTRIGEAHFAYGISVPLAQTEEESKMAIDPARFGMPDATTTGVQAGVTLTNYTGPMAINTAGTVVENKIINGTMTVNADNVTFKNCVFQNFSDYGIISENSDNTHVEFCEFDGTGSSRTYAMALGGGTSSITNCDIHGMVIAIGVWGTVNISDNYIHDLAEASSDPDARHFDGINLFAGGNGTVIDHNTIAMPGTNTGGGTAAVFITAQFGNINDVTVSNNLLYGDPSYTVYVEETRGYQITNVSLTDNYVEKGQYGYYNIVGNHSDHVAATSRGGKVSTRRRIRPAPSIISRMRSTTS